jgi:hypothetical protein
MSKKQIQNTKPKVNTNIRTINMEEFELDEDE